MEKKAVRETRFFKYSRKALLASIFSREKCPAKSVSKSQKFSEVFKFSMGNKNIIN